MREFIPALLACFVANGGCVPQPDQDLTLSGLAVVMPTPEATRGAGYFRIRNTGNASATLHNISSPDFARVEMHEILIENGTQGMQSLPQLVVEPGETVSFSVGGTHLMLIEPRPGLQAGDTVTLDFHYDIDQVLTTSAPVQTNYPFEDAN